MAVAVLDTNLIGVLTSKNHELRNRARSYLDELRANGHAILITEGTLLELSATENAHTRQVLLNSAATHLDGFLSNDADEILKLEALNLVERIGPVLPLQGLPEVVESVHGHEDQVTVRNRKRHRVLELRQFKQDLDSHFRTTPDQVPSFPTFVRERHLEFLQFYYEHHLEFLLHDRPFKTFEVIEDTLEPLWRRGRGWRICVLHLMANIHRWATRDLRKGEGSLSDAPVLVEAAYADLFLTNDKELVGCGQLINQVEETPLIRSWPIN